MPRSLVILFLASSLLPIATALLLNNEDTALQTSAVSLNNVVASSETAKTNINTDVAVDAVQVHAASIEKTTVNEPQPENDHSFALSEISSAQEAPLVRDIVSDLEIEQGLSERNLMLLREISSRLASNETQTLPENLPPAFQQTLSAMLNAELHDQELLQAWANGNVGDATTLQKTLSEHRKQILGASLYERLYSEDKLVVSLDGYSAEYAPQSQNADDKSDAIHGQTPTVDNLRTETQSYELEWQRRLLLFLDEYQYVEQAGLTDEDERLMRSELLERHFEPEDFEIVNQFIFKDQAGSIISSSAMNAEL